MSEHDPLLAALCQGDTRCPDGQALSRLGTLLRQHSQAPAPVDLWPGIVGRIHDHDPLAALRANGAAAAADPVLARLGGLVRRHAHAPRPADVLPSVASRLRELELRSSSRRLRVDGATRWRIWTMVACGHVAALVVALVWFQQWRFTVLQSGNHQAAQAAAQLRLYRQDLVRLSGAHLGARLGGWSASAGQAKQLWATRQQPLLRAQAEQAFGGESTRRSVEGLLQGLVHAQDPAGRWHAVVAERETAWQVAVQSTACLALLADGLRSEGALLALQRGLPWLMAQEPLHLEQGHGREALALGTLALCEALVYLPSTPDLYRTAERWVQALQAEPLQALGVLAISTAQVAGLPVATVQVDRHSALSLALLGLHLGQRVLPEGGYQLPASDDRADPLQWWLYGIVWRETDARAWDTWHNHMRRRLLPALSAEGADLVLPSSLWVHGEQAGPVYASAVAALILQVGHRSLPLTLASPEAAP